MADEVRLYWLKIIKRTVLCSFCGIGIALLLKGFRFGLGIGIGAIFGVVNFTSLTKDVLRSSAFKRTKIGPFFGRYLLRYLIAALALWLSYRMGGLGAFLGTAVGLLMVKIAIYTDLLGGKIAG